MSAAETHAPRRHPMNVYAKAMEKSKRDAQGKVVSLVRIVMKGK